MSEIQQCFGSVNARSCLAAALSCPSQPLNKTMQNVLLVLNEISAIYSVNNRDYAMSDALKGQGFMFNQSLEFRVLHESRS